MNKVYIQNLGMIITNKCNLNCSHCLRGCKNNKDMSKGVIEATLNQIVGIGNLCICGGEPTLALDVLEYIFSYIIDNRIFLNQVLITINGTNYSLEFLRLLNYIGDYIKCIDEKA
jgi:MoaA/NifB/PqqE/SkfB family radical SAM enzyme